MGGILGQTLENDGLQVAREIRHQAAGRWGLLSQHAHQGLRRRRPCERHLTCHQLKERGPQAVDVRAPVHHIQVPARLLGGHVRWSTLHKFGLRGRRIDGQLAGQTEIHHDREPSPIRCALNQHIARLEVAMHNAETMCLVDRRRHITDHQDLLLEREPLGNTLEGLTLDKLQRNVRATSDLTYLVDTTDVRVINPRLGARLTEEPCCHLRVCLQDELDRDDAIEATISGPIDQAHSTLTEEVKQLILVPVLREGHPPCGGRRR